MKTMDCKPALELLRRIILGVISHPEHLVIEHLQMSTSIKITLQAHASDTSRLIGEGGANYRAIASFMSLVGRRMGMRINIPPVKEPIIGENERYRFQTNTQWPKENILSLIDQAARQAVDRPEFVKVVAVDDDSTTSTSIEVRMAKTEPENLIALLQSSFSTIFDAVGKNNGRILYVDIVAGEELEPGAPQPKSAGGRFCGEINK